MVNHPIGHLNVMKLIFSILALLLVTVLTAQTQQYPAVKEGIYVDQNGNPFTGSAMLESTTNGIAQQQYIEVVNGQLHGIIKYYHPKGYVEETGSYANGQKEGQWIQFASNGVKLGEADVYFRQGPTMEWDTAAGHLLVEEAGALFHYLTDASNHYNKELLVNPPFLVKISA